ncbi:hypothetical protein GCM10015535_31830 [Streptomyces gelaticus]|uniref:Alpha-galactosidase n=1 Tax=Streptomyces gelaticus TaxID=285446 RepID=A0ABQ2W1M3_9ACTN|nr:hypothetical protein GCM10015535_31830 [Streptomyces gelaticus]
MNTAPSPPAAAEPVTASPFDDDQWWQDPSALRIDGVTVSVRASGGAVGAARGTAPGQSSLVHVTAGTAVQVTVRLDVPLGDATGFWHPDAGWERTLPADWSAWRPLSLIRSAPAGCLYDAAGQSLLAFAADRVVGQSLIRFGVSEEHKRFGVWLRFPLAPGESCLVRLATPGVTVAAALRELRDWLTELSAVRLLPVPDFARTPVYSTWYAFTQDVNAADVEAEAALAAELGCGQLFLDDGWQLHGTGRGYAGCGDWLPDPAEFPDLPGHVRKIQGLGLRHIMWIAPLLLGNRSDAHRAWAGRAPRYVPHLDCHVLDPRHRDVRDHVVTTCRTLVEENHLDGLKLDFLDEVMAYADTPPCSAREPGYIADVGQALAELLTRLRDDLRSLRGDDVVLELRQPYTGPAMTTFANALRASDCPADPVANRVRTLDVALLAPGGVVHSDMLMWDPDATPETVARHVHGALHAVPQISTRLSLLSPGHRDTLAECARRRTPLIRQEAALRSDMGDRAVRGAVRSSSSRPAGPRRMPWMPRSSRQAPSPARSSATSTSRQRAASRWASTTAAAPGAAVSAPTVTGCPNGREHRPRPVGQEGDRSRVALRERATTTERERCGPPLMERNVRDVAQHGTHRTDGRRWVAQCSSAVIPSSTTSWWPPAKNSCWRSRPSSTKPSL